MAASSVTALDDFRKGDNRPTTVASKKVMLCIPFLLFLYHY